MERNTIQRSLTLNAVKKLKNHPTVEEIYEEVAKEHPSISKGTVYRNLKELAENGDLYDVEVPGAASHFDHNCQDHYHARCIKCGKVIDVDLPYMNDLIDKIKDKHGFEFTGYDLVFKGICSKCQAKEK
jgi:Fe2+ or Zn2+ uptake regulation protein